MSLLSKNGSARRKERSSQGVTSNISSVESQKGVIAVQRCSVENQKGTIAIDFVKR